MKKNGHPYRIKYDNGVYRPSSNGHASIVVKYPNVGDVNGIAVDFQVKVDVYCDYNVGKYDTVYSDLDSWSTGTHVDLKWEDGASGAKNEYGFFAGVCVISSSWYDLTFTCYNHATGEKISMSGAYMTFSSLNGSKLSYDNDGRHWESVSYQSTKSSCKSWVMKNNFLISPCDGLFSGFDNGSSSFEDKIGGKNIEYASVCFLVQDDSPRFRFISFATESRNGLWAYPMLCPIGVLNPGAPEKSAKITS